MAYHPDDIKHSPLYPVLALEAKISGPARRRIVVWGEIFLIIFLLLIALRVLVDQWPNLSINLGGLGLLKEKAFGLILLDLALLIIVGAINAFFRSRYYFENVAFNKYRPDSLYTFTVGRILYLARRGDVLRAFMTSPVGREVMVRSGASAETLAQFLNNRPDCLSGLKLDPQKVLFLKDLVSWLYDENSDWQKFLFGQGIKKEDLLKVVGWVTRRIERVELTSRWWLRENLDRVPSIGRDWSYGQTFTLDQYCRDLLFEPGSRTENLEVSVREREVKQIEDILSRSQESNVLITGSGQSDMNIVWEFTRQIREGTILPVLEHKRILLFNTALFLSTFKEKMEFEQTLLKVFAEAIRAGDVILVLDDLATFLSGADNLHSNVAGLLDEILASSRLQVIALVGREQFHAVVENRPAVMQRFEKIVAEPLQNAAVLDILLDTIGRTEDKYGLFFTYEALQAVVESAEFYFAEGVLADKVEDLVVEIAPWLASARGTIVTREDVLQYVKRKANVPVGTIGVEEKERLSNLEELMHGRIIGQTEAVSLVASAIRRSRAGVRNPQRPIGSFLFLGPTGVGKTETAKAVAAIMFGGEDRMMRLNMTEYQAGDALQRLIGSFEDGKPGTLTSLLREKLYGVLLLDEFEKSHSDVLNLFLQILDEGQFADMNGTPVSARNLVIIATSNAGANLIWDLVGQNKNLVEATSKIIDTIVQAGTYKPELINRFDAVVIYHPLSLDDLKQIARLQLKKLVGRLEEKGIELVVTDWLVDQVATLGADKIFGARPMQRFIQNKVEQAVANKLISGELSSGFKIEFVPSPQASSGQAPLDMTITRV